MWPAFPAPVSFVASAVLVCFGGVLARVCLPAVAKTRVAKVSFIALAGVVCASHVAWVRQPFSFAFAYWGATIASVVLFLLPFAIVSVPIAALFRGVTKVALPKTTGGVTRRAALGAATAIAPIALVSTGISGFTTAAAPPRVPRIRFAWRSLHPKLHGLRILHLSDLHLGVEKHVEDVEALFDALKDDRPDLVVFTGDVAENLRELGPTLDRAIRFAPRLGVYASLGNHEYFHDASAAARIYAQKNVPLLVGAGTRVTSELFIAGADDPVYVDRDPTSFLATSIDSALEGAPDSHDSGAFRLLMCHRPEGFVPASASGVHLTLAGHTHGGQIGFNGKSAFEPIWRDKYLWGRYSRGESHLYTTSGFGHWFPFRLMCPTEAPIIELVRA